MGPRFLALPVALVARVLSRLGRGKKPAVGGQGLDELAVCPVLLGQAVSEVRESCAQQRVRDLGSADFTPTSAFEQPLSALDRVEHALVSLVQRRCGFDDACSGLVQRLLRTMCEGVHADIPDTEHFDDEIRPRVCVCVVRVHCVVSIRASRERTRAGRLPGSLSSRGRSLTSLRRSASSSRPLEISMQASVIRAAASSDWERTST